MKKVIVIAVLFLMIIGASFSIAQDKKAPKDTLKQDTTVVWQKNADIKDGIKYRMNQLETDIAVQDYKALTILYDTYDPNDPKTPEIKNIVKIRFDQLESNQSVKDYKALSIQYNTINQVLNDSLKFKKR
jgi:hypothetical protein